MDIRGNGVGDDGGGTSPHFQHLGQDINKSILALHELQNEVGALLEFRDVVIETFPQLKGKLRSHGGVGNSSNGGSAGGSVGGRWEPGVRVRRKLKEEPPRSRSNSRSKGCSVIAVQDSGFCTAESSGSKKTMEEEEVDELWCLLELIQSKGTKLRMEVESMKGTCSPTNHNRSRSLSDLESPSDKEEVQRLIQEKELLLERITEMEAENAARAEEYQSMSRRVADLLDQKKRLEEALGSTATGVTTTNYPSTPPHRNLGRLDGVLSSSPGDIIPCPAGVIPDREVTAAILKEKNVLELQRHLITTTHQNQIVHRKLEKLAKVKTALTQQLEKFKEENEDLRFQLEEKSIELEGTRARVRILEKQAPCMAIDNSTTNRSSTSVELSDHTTAEDNSSTESAHGTPSRRKQKPSRIPLKAKSSPSAPPNSLNKARAASANLNGNQKTSPVLKPRKIQVAQDTNLSPPPNNQNEGKVLYNRFAAIGNWLKISSPSP
ncbi:uncharacterized protein LOC106665486 isoform X2 [Cimex lectularius]|nr:uncharacterized protein LOC106665486 isoform X2 [Cimex lectularius]